MTVFEREVKKFLDFVTPKIDEYEELLTTNASGSNAPRTWVRFPRENASRWE